MPNSGGRARCKTPPRITAHKPPKPTTPPPGWRPPTVSGSDAGANSSATLVMSPSSSSSGAAGAAAWTPQRGDGTPLTAAAAASSPAPAPPLASLGSRGDAAATHCGYLAKLGDVSNVLLGKRTWKRRFFVLDAGHLAYYESAAQYEAGAAPMKGNRLDVRDFAMAVTAGDVPLPDGADIALEPAGAAAAGAGASPAAAAAGAAGAPPSTPSLASRLHLSRLGSSSGSSISSPAGGGGGGGGVTSPGSPAAAGGAGGASSRVWKFRCESAEDVQAWSRALAAHGCRRKAA